MVKKTSFINIELFFQQLSQKLNLFVILRNDMLEQIICFGLKRHGLIDVYVRWHNGYFNIAIFRLLLCWLPINVNDIIISFAFIWAFAFSCDRTIHRRQNISIRDCGLRLVHHCVWINSL